MSRSLAILLAIVLIQAAAHSAPVPKKPPNPLAKKLVGTWRYDSGTPVIPPWGTAVATLTGDGKVTATFGPDLSKTGGLFADTAGTYKVDGNTLRTTILMGKGSKYETERKDVMTVLKVTADELHLVYKNDKQKRAFILKREKPDKPRKSEPDKKPAE
jgi:uncharacterized protein (TIGR03066 family)